MFLTCAAALCSEKDEEEAHEDRGTEMGTSAPSQTPLWAINADVQPWVYRNGGRIDRRHNQQAETARELRNHLCFRDSLVGCIVWEGTKHQSAAGSTSRWIGGHRRFCRKPEKLGWFRADPIAFVGGVHHRPTDRRAGTFLLYGGILGDLGRQCLCVQASQTPSMYVVSGAVVDNHLPAWWHDIYRDRMAAMGSIEHHKAAT